METNNQTTRTGTISSMGATRSVYTTLLVRELDDGSIEYLVGGFDGALLNASGCIQIDHHDDGTRQLSADRDGVVSGVAGRVGQIVDGVYVERRDWTEQDLSLVVRS